MIAIPALDLRSGACVQLVGGSYDREVVRLPDPVGVAHRWSALGFQRLHLVDLDAATSRGTNASIVQSILASGTCRDVQVGGGVRTDEQIAAMLGHGAARIVIGSRALEEPSWLAAAAARFPHRLVVAADVDGRQVLTRGWQAALDLDIEQALDALVDLPLAGVLVTAVHREGRLGGPDTALMQLVVRRAAAQVYAAGGVATIADLQALASCGVHATVVGTALYTGALDALHVLEEFSQ